MDHTENAKPPAATGALSRDTNKPITPLETTLVSVVKNAVDVETATTTAGEMLDGIRSGRWRREIEAVRSANATRGKDATDALKKRLPGILWSGTFRQRAADAVEDRNGLLCLDIDKVGSEALADLRSRIDADPVTLASFISPTGTGIKVLVRIDASRPHIEGFTVAREHFRAAHGVTLDEKPKNVASLCFVSWDPALYVNPAAAPVGPISPTVLTTVNAPAVDIEAELERVYGPRYSWGEEGKSKKLVPVGFNGMHFAALYGRGRDILHDPATARFYLYEPETGLWRPTTPQAVKVDLGGMLLDVARGDDCETLAVRSRTDHLLTGWLNHLRGIVERPDPFGQRPAGLLHCSNGVFHVPTNELLAFAPDHLSRNMAPIRYDPRATCPCFLSVLLLPAVDADDIRLIQLYAGSCLLGRNLGQRILLLLGTPGGGKSTLVAVIELVVGLANVAQLRTELLAERFESFRFVDKTLLVGKDVPGSFLQTKGAHVLKALVGGDILETERKGATETAQIRGEFHAIVTSNSRLKVKLDGDAGAWERRLLVVEYERPKPETPIPDLAGRLVAEEGPGILNWMIDGARALLANGFRFELTEAQKRRVWSILRESDSLRAFVRECVTVAPGHDATTDELARAYGSFCDLMGWAPMPLRQVENQLGDLLMEVHRIGRRHDVKRDGRSARGYGNCRVSRPTLADDDAA